MGKNKLKSIILVFLSILLLLFVWYVFKKITVDNTIKNGSQELVMQVKSIQDKIQLINSEKDYQTKTLNNEEFLNQMTDGGGQLIGYFKNGQISKISERLGLSYGVKTYEYYFGDGQLILVFEKEVRLPSGARMDAYNPDTKQIIELKPNNPAAIPTTLMSPSSASQMNPKQESISSPEHAAGSARWERGRPVMPSQETRNNVADKMDYATGFFDAIGESEKIPNLGHGIALTSLSLIPFAPEATPVLVDVAYNAERAVQIIIGAANIGSAISTYLSNTVRKGGF